MANSPNSPRWHDLRKIVRQLDVDPTALNNKGAEFPSFGQSNLSIGIFPAVGTRPFAGATVTKVATKNGIEALEREVRLTRKLSHTNIRKCCSLTVTRGKRYAYAHFEQTTGIDLLDMIVQAEPFPTENVPHHSVDVPNFESVRHILRSVLQGLAYLHSMHIVHNDMKPQNIMVSASRLSEVTTQTSVKIIDLGLAFEADKSDDTGPTGGDPEWASPEKWFDQHITAASDVFEFGAIVYSTFSNTAFLPHKWHEGDIVELQKQLTRTHRRLLQSKHSLYTFSPLREAIIACTNFYPEHRPSAGQLLGAPFFTHKVLSRAVTEGGDSTNPTASQASHKE